MTPRILSLLSILLLTISHALAQTPAPPPPTPIIPVFDLAGSMTETPVDASMALFGPPPPNLRDIVTRMDKAAKDPNVKAVVILEDDAVLGLAQCEELRQAMKNLRDAGKDVYAHADSMEFLEFILASGATNISIAPEGMIYAAGIHADEPYIHGLLLKLGVQPDFIHSGAYKSASEIMMRDGPSPEAEAMTNWLVDSVYDTAIQLVATGRSVGANQVKSWFDGALYTPEKAKSTGMIDSILDRTELTSMLKDKYGQDAVFDKTYAAEKPPTLNFSNPFALMQIFAQLMNPPKSTTGKPTVGIVYVDGLIISGKNTSGLFGSGIAASDDIVKALKEAQDDDSVKAVVLRVASPGGSATASEIILRATQRLKATKPLVVSMGDVAGSGGYYVTCASDTLFADASTLTASIGGVTGKLSTTGMWNKIGITFKAYQRGANADLLSDDGVFSPDQRQQMQVFTDDLVAVFENHVTTNRAGKLKKSIDELAAGRVFTGAQALDNGLVDRIGTLADAISFIADEAKISDYDVRTIPAPKNILQQLMEQSTGDDSDTTSLTTASDPNWLVKLAQPYLAGIDPHHAAAITAALLQVEMIQRGEVLMAMPATFCVRPAIH
jgi:protease-4